LPVDQERDARHRNAVGLEPPPHLLPVTTRPDLSVGEALLARIGGSGQTLYVAEKPVDPVRERAATPPLVSRDPFYVMFRKEIGGRIRARRVELGMSESELANALDVPEGAISQWEQGSLPWDRISELAEVLDVSPEWIVHGRDPIEVLLAELRAQMDEALALLRVKTGTGRPKT